MAHVVEVLGPGCRRCAELHELVRRVAAAECPDIELRYITDPVEIVGRGLVFKVPALVIDGRVVAAGRVPSQREISAWLQAPTIHQEAHP